MCFLPSIFAAAEGGEINPHISSLIAMSNEAGRGCLHTGSGNVSKVRNHGLTTESKRFETCRKFSSLVCLSFHTNSRASFLFRGNTDSGFSSST